MNQNDISSMFEHEFGRMLTPIELEIIEDWKKNGFEDSTIRDALKEAVFNGAVSFRYINKILDSWKSVESSVDVLTKQEQDLSWLNGE